MTDPSTTPDGLAAAGLRYAVDGAVATVTLARPDVRNAQTPLMWRTLALLGEQIPDDVDVVVVTGEGPTFSSGLDRRMLDPATTGEESVVALLELGDEEISATIEAYQAGFTWLHDPRFVSVAAVRGHAVGAGFQLALACDLRVLADDAQLCMKEAALGLVPDLAGTQPLVECVGYARALEICATARMVGAQEAGDIGLATAVVPAAALETTVADLAAALAAPSPGVVTETKRLLQGATRRTLEEQARLEREAQVRRFRSIAVAGAGQKED